MATTGSHTEPLQDQARAAKESARQALDEQRHSMASQLGELADSIRKAQLSPQYSAITNTAADGLERLSGALHDKDLNRLLHDVESFARRQPVAFFGAAVAAGFLAVRFLKSSNDRGGDTPYPY